MSMLPTEKVSDQPGLVTSSLSTKITEYSEWRTSLIATIDEYIDWLGQSDSLDAVQELRLYDIKEILEKRSASDGILSGVLARQN